ncbi:MAG: hypothetical protein ACRDGV_07035 [Candidatus Limnocylindria bacterium]
MKHAQWIIGVLVLGAGCGGPSPSATKDPGPGDALSEALAMLPLDVRELALTDWALIREIEGLEREAETDGSAQREALFLSTIERQAPTAWFARAYGPSHLDAWGWDAADADWEASATLADGTSVALVQLWSGFATDELLALFAERRYVESRVSGATIYTVERDLFIDWQTDSDTAMLNVGVTEDTRRLVMSESVPAIEAVLAAAAGEAESVDELADVTQSGAQLAGAAAIEIRIGGSPCAGFLGLLMYPPEQVEPMIELLQGVAVYQVFGMGYRYDGDRPVFQAVMAYDDERRAERDAPAREHLAEFHGSVSGVYAVVGARSDGSSIALTLEPRVERVATVMNLLEANELVFAACL